VVSGLDIGPIVRGFKPGQGRPNLIAIKIRSTTSFGGEVKPSAPCRKILRQVKERYGYKRDFVGKIHLPFLRHVSPASLIHVSGGNCQRALMDELGMIRNEMGTQNEIATQMIDFFRTPQG
jgi:hypothetical protein